MERSYRTEFPDYDGALPYLMGWRDYSSRNDVSPSLIRRQAAGEFQSLFMRIWCDYVDPAKREPEGSKRFTFDVQPAEDVDEPRLSMAAETIEGLRCEAVNWYCAYVADSILEENLSTVEVFDKVAIAWGTQNSTTLRDIALSKAVIHTGGGCKAYAFEFGLEDQVWVTVWDGCGLPVEGEAKLICFRDHQGGELACLKTADDVSMDEILAFLKQMGAVV